MQAGWNSIAHRPIDDKTGLPYNLVDTPPEHITVTSRLSPEFNERHHPYCGLISSMHSWGLYNGRYGLSRQVLLDKIAAKDRPLADKMLNGELDRQKRLKAELAKDPQTSGWLDERKVFQNYKQLAVHRHAGALFQPDLSERARRADFRERPHQQG